MILANYCVLGLSIISLLIRENLAEAKDASTNTLSQTKCEGSDSPGVETPVPADPYPLMAAGWGPEVGNGLLFSRWAEDWTGMRAVGDAPFFKAIPLGGESFLTLSAEGRMRYDSFENKLLISDASYQQRNFRGILGADLRFNPSLRIYSEVGSGHVDGPGKEITANFQNRTSLQQFFLDARTQVDAKLIGVMVGRQEFTDGPKQLISLGDGPNLHRTWNGERFYFHNQGYRLGVFDLRSTRLQQGSFDEEINYAERLQGANASFIVSQDGKPNIYLEPFLFHSVNPVLRLGGQSGHDSRDTYGVRVWGRQDTLRFDWTLARQTGEFNDRSIDAWGLFAIQSIALANDGWNPRLTARVDIASGGGTYGTRKILGFNQLYASSNYIGEGQFLSLSNLLMVTPGFSISPLRKVNLAVDYGSAWRLKEDDAVYAGGMRAYAGTQNKAGHDIGKLFRIMTSWSPNDDFALFLNYEQFLVGEILKHAGLPSGRYGYVGSTFRI